MPGLSEQGGLAIVQSKRGCPFHCIYCTYPLIEGRKVRVREPIGVWPGKSRPWWTAAWITFFL